MCYYAYMKQKHNHLLNRYTVSSLAFVAVLAITALSISILRHNQTEAAPPSKSTTAAVSQFSFTGATDWWQGATNKTSMALFHNTDGCFVSAQYKTGNVDIAAELHKLQISQAGDGGTSTPGAVLTVALQTSSGSQQYRLHQYSLSPANGEKLMEGLELGYLQLPNGYVQIEGHCDTPDQLSATIPALRAIEFDETK